MNLSFWIPYEGPDHGLNRSVDAKAYLRLKIYELPIFFRDESYVCIATASPAKFPEAIEKSGVTYVNPDEIQKLFDMEEKYDRMDQGQDWEKILRSKIEEISSKS